jgi:hypothetical protein
MVAVLDSDRNAGATMDDQPSDGGSTIALRVETISQLFHTLDASPFREKDLDKDAEEYIVSWARELPNDQPLRISVHLPKTEAATPEAQEFGAAIAQYFRYRAEVTTLELKEFFRIGRRVLVIGVVVLAASVIVSQTVATKLTPAPVARLVEESLIIFGWVANWRPIEIFLYDWWPIVRRRNLFHRLSQAIIELKPDPR